MAPDLSLACAWRGSTASSRSAQLSAVSLGVLRPFASIRMGGVSFFFEKVGMNRNRTAGGWTWEIRGGRISRYKCFFSDGHGKLGGSDGSMDRSVSSSRSPCAISRESHSYPLRASLPPLTLATRPQALGETLVRRHQGWNKRVVVPQPTVAAEEGPRCAKSHLCRDFPRLLSGWEERCRRPGIWMIKRKVASRQPRGTEEEKVEDPWLVGAGACFPVTERGGATVSRKPDHGAWCCEDQTSGTGEEKARRRMACLGRGLPSIEKSGGGLPKPARETWCCKRPTRGSEQSKQRVRFQGRMGCLGYSIQVGRPHGIPQAKPRISPVTMSSPVTMPSSRHPVDPSPPSDDPVFLP